MASSNQIFLNECSLEEQYLDPVAFEAAIKVVTAMVAAYQTMMSTQLLKSALLCDFHAIKGQDFRASLNKLRDKSVRTQFIVTVLDKRNPPNWQQDQVHLSTDDFCVLDRKVTGTSVTELAVDRKVTGTSVAELAERKLRDRNLGALLLNFPQSTIFSQESVQVKKNFQLEVVLDSASSVEQIANWYRALPDTAPVFPIEENRKPLGRETILSDNSRFRPTSKSHAGARIYEEIRSGNLFYLDSLHVGEAAHIEVFNRRGRHLYEANLDGSIRPNTTDSSKNLARELRR